MSFSLVKLEKGGVGAEEGRKKKFETEKVCSSTAKTEILQTVPTVFLANPFLIKIENTC